MNLDKHHLVNETTGEPPVIFKESPNHGGTFKPLFLVMHYTAGHTAQSSADWLCNSAAKASAHVVIGKDGAIIQLVPFNIVAWHAGISRWKDEGVEYVGMNNYAIGIEFDNPGRLVRAGANWRSLSLGINYPDDEVIEATHKSETKPSGWHVYPQAQLETALSVASMLFEAYDLNDVVGHDDVAPMRKFDPGPAFPMTSFRARLLGRSDNGPEVSPRFTTITALNIRVGPGVQYSTVIPRPLPPGTVVTAIASDGGWRQVDVIGSVGGLTEIHGWVNGRYLEAAKPG
jgi:N-acetylmuramoyl-L-alanine amidase